MPTTKRMTLIAGLWLVLLPGQLDLSQRDSQSGSLWQRLHENGQAAVDEWHKSFGQTEQALQAAEQELNATAGTPAEAAQAAEISRFGDRLNEEIIEPPDSETSNSQSHASEEETE